MEDPRSLAGEKRDIELDRAPKIMLTRHESALLAHGILSEVLASPTLNFSYTNEDRVERAQRILAEYWRRRE